VANDVYSFPKYGISYHMVVIVRWCKVAPKTLFAKVWEPHVVDRLDDGPDVLAIDLHLIHEVTSLDAFELLNRRGLKTRHPERTLGVADHIVPITTDWTPRGRDWAQTLERNCAEHGIPHLPYGHAKQGIAHVIGPELGLSRPGMTIACGDSHTSTHGALGAVAFGIGTTQVAHVLASQALLINRPKTMEIRVDGTLRPGAASKDLALALLARYGNLAAAGHAVEYRGSAIEALSAEARMTLCNMGIELGARMSMIAPDAVTAAYLGGPVDPGLTTDDGADFDARLTLHAGDVRPYVTWGTTPAQSVPLGSRVPAAGDEATQRALTYSGLVPGAAIADTTIDAAFIGSCTNGRIEDLRAAAEVLRGRHVARGVRAVVAPGSMTVRARAEEEGLDQVFRAAGFEWGRAGCSLCIAANGEVIPAGARCASTTNRNFEGRQGTGSRTHLMSPASVAASAVAGRLISAEEL
jgi:3-isopropylmalate/(R)-2-methylmalate dehydratase large subunit